MKIEVNKFVCRLVAFTLYKDKNEHMHQIHSSFLFILYTLSLLVS